MCCLWIETLSLVVKVGGKLWYWRPPFIKPTEWRGDKLMRKMPLTDQRGLCDNWLRLKKSVTAEGVKMDQSSEPSNRLPLSSIWRLSTDLLVEGTHINWYGSTIRTMDEVHLSPSSVLTAGWIIEKLRPNKHQREMPLYSLKLGIDLEICLLDVSQHQIGQYANAQLCQKLTFFCLVMMSTISTRIHPLTVLYMRSGLS